MALAGAHLKDHPRTCKWSIIMVIVSPLRVVGPLPNGRYKWLINEGDPITTYVCPGMILQVGPGKFFMTTRRHQSWHPTNHACLVKLSAPALTLREGP